MQVKSETATLEKCALSGSQTECKWKRDFSFTTALFIIYGQKLSWVKKNFQIYGNAAFHENFIGEFLCKGIRRECGHLSLRVLFVKCSTLTNLQTFSQRKFTTTQLVVPVCGNADILCPWTTWIANSSNNDHPLIVSRWADARNMYSTCIWYIASSKVNCCWHNIPHFPLSGNESNTETNELTEKYGLTSLIYLLFNTNCLLYIAKAWFTCVGVAFLIALLSIIVFSLV